MSPTTRNSFPIVQEEIRTQWDFCRAQVFVTGNARLNHGTEPVICAVCAKSANIWRSSVGKVNTLDVSFNLSSLFSEIFSPAETLIVHDSSNPDTAKACEAARNEYVNLVGPGTPYASTVRYSNYIKS